MNEYEINHSSTYMVIKIILFGVPDYRMYLQGHLWIPSLTPITHKQGQFADGLETTVHKIGGSFTYNHLGDIYT